jgi:hypothetical protein
MFSLWIKKAVNNYIGLSTGQKLNIDNVLIENDGFF